MRLVNIANEDVKKTLIELIGFKIPITTSWKLKKLAIEYDKHHAMYEQSKNDLVKKYAIADENGSPVVDADGKINVSPENMKEFTEELNELLNIEVEMPSISITELSALDPKTGKPYVDIETKKLIILGDLITD